MDLTPRVINSKYSSEAVAIGLKVHGDSQLPVTLAPCQRKFNVWRFLGQPQLIVLNRR